MINVDTLDIKNYNQSQYTPIAMVRSYKMSFRY